jgi:tRNA A37 threonylcarbamoyladenosine dehydratase
LNWPAQDIRQSENEIFGLHCMPQCGIFARKQGNEEGPMKEQDYISGLLERTLLFYREETVEKVRDKVFAIAGFGGVGAITAELLARWGIRKFRLLDKDRYEPSNLNRQLFATSRTLGQYKTDVAAERILEINPYAKIEMAIKEPVDNPTARPVSFFIGRLKNIGCLL